MKAVIIVSLLIAESTIAQTLKVTYPPFLQQQETGSNSARQAFQHSPGQITQSVTTPSSVTWQIPFASVDNTILLGIQNRSSVAAKNVSVTFGNLPSWIKFKSNTYLIKSIAPDLSQDAEFTFSIDRKAPVGKDTTLTATIKSSDGETWAKEIKISISAPKDYKLYDNFPNPFNPSTKIAFELPKASHVKLMIYDNIGREVAQVADADYPTGYSELTWNGTNKNGSLVSSGIYFCRINAGRWSKVMKMMVLK